MTNRHRPHVPAEGHDVTPAIQDKAAAEPLARGRLQRRQSAELLWPHIRGCLGDADGDGMVNFDDLNLVLLNWNTAGPDGDANNDGAVDFGDLNAVLLNWNTVCPS